MSKFWLIFIFFHCTVALSQSATASFFELSGPEKYWVITHFIKAKKAFKITEEVLKKTDSVGKTGLLDGDVNGGQLDAFKHSYWIARLTISIGKKAALRLGEAHEKGNYRDFKNSKKEDGWVPDKIASQMDLLNNSSGAMLGSATHFTTDPELIQVIADEIKAGNMKIIKKDREGNFLDCSGSRIPPEKMYGKWETPKCLVNSDD
jgi:hypothetical protein